jgi:hypothetical protein
MRRYNVTVSQRGRKLTLDILAPSETAAEENAKRAYLSRGLRSLDTAPVRVVKVESRWSA